MQPVRRWVARRPERRRVAKRPERRRVARRPERRPERRRVARRLEVLGTVRSRESVEDEGAVVGSAARAVAVRLATAREIGTARRVRVGAVLVATAKEVEDPATVVVGTATVVVGTGKGHRVVARLAKGVAKVQGSRATATTVAPEASRIEGCTRCIR